MPFILNSPLIQDGLALTGDPCSRNGLIILRNFVCSFLDDRTSIGEKFSLHLPYEDQAEDNQENLYP